MNESTLHNLLQQQSLSLPSSCRLLHWELKLVTGNIFTLTTFPIRHACDRWSLCAEEIGNLLLRQPCGLVFKTHVQPNGLVRLIDDNLVLGIRFWHCCIGLFVVQGDLSGSHTLYHFPAGFGNGNFRAAGGSAGRLAPPREATGDKLCLKQVDFSSFFMFSTLGLLITFCLLITSGRFHDRVCSPGLV